MVNGAYDKTTNLDNRFDNGLNIFDVITFDGTENSVREYDIDGNINVKTGSLSLVSGVSFSYEINMVYPHWIKNSELWIKSDVETSDTSTYVYYDGDVNLSDGDEVFEMKINFSGPEIDDDYDDL